MVMPNKYLVANIKPGNDFKNPLLKGINLKIILSRYQMEDKTELPICELVPYEAGYVTQIVEKEIEYINENHMQPQLVEILVINGHYLVTDGNNTVIAMKRTGQDYVKVKYRERRPEEENKYKKALKLNLPTKGFTGLKEFNTREERDIILSGCLINFYAGK
jgi:hypothetical protein